MSSGGPRWHSLIKGTEAQIEALTSDKYLTVVSAGAGTGKTQTLAQRFAWLLASDPECGVGEVLVLTFTKKAAREMQERIKGTLERWYAECPDELAHLKSRIEGIDDAYISTIHSFAMKIIRESGLALDIDPTASIMPAPKADIWWREFASMLSSASEERILAALPAEWRARASELMREPEFIEMLNAFGPEAVAEAAKSCSEKLYCAGQSPESLWEHDDTELTASIDSLKELKKDIYELWSRDVFPAILSTPEFSGGGNRKPTKAKEKLAPFIERWLAAPAASDEALSQFCGELFESVLVPLPGGKIKDAISEALGKGLKEWRDETKALLALAVPPSEGEKRVNALLCRVCAVGWACWDEFRRRENLLSLSDLIFYASEVLNSSTDYKRKFKHIMVDEFQDTDPLQDGLIEALWVTPEAESDFHNTLFLVGDQKQSIYRFRHADLTLFRGYIERCRRHGAEGYCKYVSLDQNFRTASGLLEKFNGLFGELWSGGSEIFYEPLLPPQDEDIRERRNASVERPQLELLCAVSPYGDRDEKILMPELRLRLYSELGRRMARMREEGRLIWDKGRGEFRPVRWRDFAVLVPARTEYSMIERAFERLGLPYLLSTNKNYFARGEIGDLVNLISLLAEPENPLFLGGWLASPFSGVSIEEAERMLAAALESRESRKELPLAEVVHREHPELCARLEHLRRTALLSGVSAVILEILREPSFLENYGGLRRRRVNANIIYLAQLAEEYERSQGKSLKGCAEYLLSAASSEGAKEEPDAADEDTDAIQVMTIHASKGLEFPVVALIYADKRGPRSSALQVSKRYGVIAKETPDFLLHEEPGGKNISAMWEMKEESEAESAERDRLWYVGFTRAQDRLILCAAYQESKADAEGGKSPTLLSRTAGVLPPEDISHITEEPEELPKYAPYEAKAQTEGMALKIVSPAKLGRISASAYALISWCPAAYRTVYRQGRTVSWTVKGGEGGGSDFGSLTHWLLARWDFRAESLVRWLPFSREGQGYEAVMRRLPVELRDEFASGAKRREIRELLQRYAQSEECSLFAELASAESPVKLFREMPFRVPDRGTVLVGATDLFWRDDSGLHLRDWKSSSEEYAPSYYYERQLEFYAYALHRFFEPRGGVIPIDSAVIYLRSQDNERKIRLYGTEDFKAVGGLIEAAAIEALSGNFVGKKERCAACPWRTDCEAR